MKRNTLLVLLLCVFALISCEKEPVLAPATVPVEVSVPAPANTITVDEDFNWSNSRNVNFSVNISTERYPGSIHLISIYEGDPAEGKLLGKGSATDQAGFKCILFLPLQLKNITIVCTAPDNTKTMLKCIIADSNSINVTLTATGTVAASAPAPISDTDGDGVADILDEYPKDAQKAFNNYSSAGAGSTIAFEDQWPVIGDFDLNDMVVDCSYNVISNAKNMVVKVIADFKLRAAGGDYANGFGVEFPVPAKSISGLSGASLEDRQEKAVIILFSNMHAEIAGRNVNPDEGYVAAKTFHVSFDLANGPSLDSFGLDYNPFLFTMIGTSRREVHLVGKTPTSLADRSLFGTEDDNSNAAAGRYYITKSGFPYAISVPVSSFNYPQENMRIGHAYKHFTDWAISGGKSYQDWYSNTSEGYREQRLIYSK